MRPLLRLSLKYKGTELFVFAILHAGTVEAYSMVENDLVNTSLQLVASRDHQLMSNRIDILLTASRGKILKKKNICSYRTGTVSRSLNV